MNASARGGTAADVRSPAPTGRGSAMSSRAGCCLEKIRLGTGEIGDGIGECIGDCAHEAKRLDGGEDRKFAYPHVRMVLLGR